MVIFLTAVLLCSSLGMVLLLAIKHWEVSKDRMLFRSTRAQVNESFAIYLNFFASRLPSLAQEKGRTHIEAVEVWCKGMLARVLLKAEGVLERMLRTLKQTTAPHSAQGQVSAFLQEIAEHKRTLAHTREHSLAR
ncbi:MAG: hypothetical protein KGJ34_00065 [Patescibacteria group bacterium]|nr:hypothetical protein [Patescibacteria group bacterium]